MSIQNIIAQNRNFKNAVAIASILFTYLTNIAPYAVFFGSIQWGVNSEWAPQTIFGVVLGALLIIGEFVTPSKKK